jgi:hypothetical protein
MTPPEPSIRLVGADLYIQSLHEANEKKYRPRFLEYIRRRDQAKTDAARKRFDNLVWDTYDRMHTGGYFRDSYNDSNLLWQLGLDYWVWFAGHLDAEGYLQPDQATAVLAEVETRRPRLDEIEDKEEADYFREKYEEFTTFLRTAIDRGEPVYCSI